MENERSVGWKRKNEGVACVLSDARYSLNASNAMNEKMVNPQAVFFGTDILERPLVTPTASVSFCDI